MKIEKINGEKFYKIENCNQMRPFFMSIVSDSNHWMFISSNGGISAGRKNAEQALFPYYTDDKIIHSWDNTGSKTIVRIHGAESDLVWEPFSHRFNEKYNFQRNLYKSIYGNCILFEEVLHDFNIVFRYRWSSSDRFGFVKTSEIENLSDKSIEFTILDGFQNILPYGVPSDLQLGASNLVDAYKRNELHEPSGMGIYALSAIIVDKAEPSEALKCNIAWSIGIDSPTHLVSSRQLNAFRYQGNIEPESDIKGERGAYFMVKKMALNASQKKDWHIVANVNQNQSQVVAQIKELENLDLLKDKLLSDISLGTKKLIQLVSSADGVQYTSDDRKNIRHFSNTLFNIMRGGIFDNNYLISKIDFVHYISKANSLVHRRCSKFFENLTNEFNYPDLLERLKTEEDVDLIRLSIEYLPLRFSRRHGDPSRPWNKFSINTSDEKGNKLLDYEGNWRDIFQNWEALAISYPTFIEGFIFKFLNATTFDGYNPYRVTKSGFDWEKVEKNNPWSHIGYWGDHQIIYLLKFLEFIESTDPGKLSQYFDKEYFVYAAVPYRIRPYDKLLENPQQTIDYDYDWEDLIQNRTNEFGSDGAFIKDNIEGIYHVNLIEKLLATSLAKMSNFVPGGGIWLNTQRPEWNDANNALVGNGLSMVTLYYLRRFFKFFDSILENTNFENFKISNELVDFYHGVREGLLEHRDILDREPTDFDKKLILDLLGKVASDYRTHIYTYGFWGKKRTHSIEGLKRYVHICLEFIEQSIRLNIREDKLYHSYNLMSYSESGIQVSHLDEMLEGQVAVLSSGYLNNKERVELLHSLKNSSLYREDAKSYILYPNKNLPKFLEKNNISKDKITAISLLNLLEEENNPVIVNKDANGVYHFNGNFNNANALKMALLELGKKETYKNLVSKDSQAILNLYEEIFNHKAFTGRSGTFFAYEGLGSIYWHMVSKLNLAIAENIETLDDSSLEVKHTLINFFTQNNIGIGLYKSPTEYGAFPTDPYSHTPSHRGAQQPGMTGQVKEDILSRFKELGVIYSGGKLSFSPKFLDKIEFLKTNKKTHYIDILGVENTIELPENSLLFTLCQIPVVYILSTKDEVMVQYDSREETIVGTTLTEELSRKIWNRTGEIKSIHVSLNY